MAGIWTLFNIFLSFAGKSGKEYAPFWIGILSYIVLQAFLYKPMRAYVFGHELTHALAGILSGAKIKKFRVGKESGSVVLSKNNIWITLSPYFIPIYTFIVILVYLIIGWFRDAHLYYSYFLFFMGFTIAFHLALTIYIMRIGQSDLKVYGLFFSYVVILSVNILVFDILTVIAFPKEIDLAALIKITYDNILEIYNFIFQFFN
jgi:hypothetical protein